MSIHSPKGDADVVNKAVMTSSGTTSKTVAEKFGFEFCTSDKEDIFSNDEINTVFICTRHNSHAGYVLDALKSIKNVFVEKPLCLTIEEFENIKSVYSSLHAPHSSLLVGFNRRFSLLAKLLKEKIGEGPMSMIYRVNAGSIPADSWIQDPVIGGGRVIGEVCHFIDFLTYMSESLPQRVFATALPDSQNFHDTLNINLEFENGSIGTVSYFANGSRNLAKEYIEVYRTGTTGIIKDFREVEVFGTGKPYRKKLLSQDKGQKTMIHGFLKAIKEGGNPLIEPAAIFAVTQATFLILESLKRHEALTVDL